MRPPRYNRFGDQVFPARLTGKSGSSPIKYAWEELQIKEDGTLTTVTGKRVGSSTDAWAVEINNIDVDVTSQPMTWLRLRGMQSGQPVFEFCWTGLAGSAVGSIVKITSVTADAAGYPAKLQTQDPAFHIWVDGSNVRVIMSNSETPVLDKRYLVWDTGTTKTVSGTTYAIYASDYFPDPLGVKGCYPATDTGSLATYTPGTIYFVESSGLQVQNSGTQASVTLIEADETQPGSVTYRNQRWWGRKQFINGTATADGNYLVANIIASGSPDPQVIMGGMTQLLAANLVYLFSVSAYSGSTFDITNSGTTGVGIILDGIYGRVTFAKCSGGVFQISDGEPTIRVGNGVGYDTGVTGTLRGIKFRAGFCTGSSGISGYTGTVP